LHLQAVRRKGRLQSPIALPDVIKPTYSDVRRNPASQPSQNSRQASSTASSAANFSGVWCFPWYGPASPFSNFFGCRSLPDLTPHFHPPAKKIGCNACQPGATSRGINLAVRRAGRTFRHGDNAVLSRDIGVKPGLPSIHRTTVPNENIVVNSSACDWR
jgi:hypothetical protein